MEQWGQVVEISKLVSEGLLEKVTYDQHFENGDQISHA